jgi:carboxypeptidase Taq
MRNRRSKGPFPAERQQAIAVDLLRRLGFDFDHGRLDTSHHPFCIGTPGDVRVTTRFETSDCMDSALSVLHECGHAKYEQNLPWDWRTQPVGSAPAVSIHESQSLLHENHIGRSRAFLEFVAPLLREAFPEFSEDFRPECLFRRMTRVRPGALRSQADEATYPCHIVLRFELESALIGGALQPEDVPEAWNAGMRDLLGVSTEGNDCDGCMQDMHWPAGLFGYFPSYVLGALTAAQLLEAFQRQYPDFEVKVRQGDLSAVDEWLRQRVWSKGSLLQAGELIESATGRALETAPFEAYLTRRYVQRTL